MQKLQIFTLEQIKSESLYFLKSAKRMCVFFFLLIGNFLFSQNVNYEWAKSIGDSGFEEGTSVTYDAAGNVYTTGRFYDTVDFNPGSGTNNLSSNGSSDIFISKLDASGNFVWAKKIGGIGADKANSIHIDALGNIYITGFFSSTVDFDPGIGTSNLTSTGSTDIFILKLNASGNFVWAKKMGGSGADEAFDITLDNRGNIYSTGRFSSTVDFDPGTSTSNLVSNGLYDIFILKLTPSGNYDWAKSIGGTTVEEAYGISVDTAGNVFTTGRFEGTKDFDPGIGITNLVSNGNRDAFILKLTTSGNFLWAKQIGGISQDVGTDIIVDKVGDVFISGYFNFTVDFDPGSGISNLTSNGITDAFILKLSASGNFVWAKSMGGTNIDGAYSISLDDDGNVYTIGIFYGTGDFDPNTGTSNLTAVGTRSDVFISKLDDSGNYVWAGRIGGIGDDMANSITTDNAGNIYSTGSYSDSVDFDPGIGTNILNSNNGSSDLYILKLSCQPVLGLQTKSVKNHIVLYPNPATSHVTISNLDKEIVTITITDVTGKIIKSFTPNTSVIELSMFPPGVYFVKIQQGKEFVTKKIIKQ